MQVWQWRLDGGLQVETGSRVKNQLAQIMDAEPETVDDEDLLAARWLEKTMPVADTMDIYPGQLARIIRCYRKANIRARRQELRHLYPYSPEEEQRRQARGRGGPPG